MIPLSSARTPRIPAAVWIPGLLFLLATLLVLGVDGRPLGPDLALHRWALDHRTEGAVTAARLLTDTGIGPLVVLLAVVAGLGLAGRGASRAARTGSVLFALAVVASGPLVRRLLSMLIDRPRPPAGGWAVFADGWAYPSGHTGSATVVAVLLIAAFAAPHIRALIALWAIGVGLTRIYLGMHWPTDVLAGWAFGICWVAAALWLRERILHRTKKTTASS